MNIQRNQTLDTNVFFSGGAGMFIQYHDIVKPVYMMAIIKMILNHDAYGLPIEILENLSIPSLMEWYFNRRYINPLTCLDIYHKVDPKDLDALLKETLENDPSLYSLSPSMNIRRLFFVYTSQHMAFPVYVYTKEYEASVQADASASLGVQVKYLYGDLKECIKKCQQNFTYIFSDIELMKQASEILHGTYSCLVLASDYRYNRKHGVRSPIKYNLKDMAEAHPFLRCDLTTACDPNALAYALKGIIPQKGDRDVTNQRNKTGRKA